MATSFHAISPDRFFFCEEGARARGEPPDAASSLGRVERVACILGAKRLREMIIPKVTHHSLPPSSTASTSSILLRSLTLRVRFKDALGCLSPLALVEALRWKYPVRCRSW